MFQEKLTIVASKKDSSMLEEDLKIIGALYAHYNRKEKLIFPILERKQVYTLPRKIWALDDDNRATYHQFKNRLKRMDEIEFKHIRKSFDTLNKGMKQMILHEEDILIPLIQELFTAQEYEAIANESKAFGYAVDVKSVWSDKEKVYQTKETESEDKNQNIKI